MLSLLDMMRSDSATEILDFSSDAEKPSMSQREQMLSRVVLRALCKSQQSAVLVRCVGRGPAALFSVHGVAWGCGAPTGRACSSSFCADSTSSHAARFLQLLFHAFFFLHVPFFVK